MSSSRFRLIDGFIFDTKTYVPITTHMTLGTLRLHPAVIPTLYGYERIFALVQHIADEDPKKKRKEIKKVLTWFRPAHYYVWYETAALQDEMQQLSVASSIELRKILNDLRDRVINNTGGLRESLKNPLLVVEYDGEMYVIDTSTKRGSGSKFQVEAGKIVKIERVVRTPSSYLQDNKMESTVFAEDVLEEIEANAKA